MSEDFTGAQGMSATRCTVVIGMAAFFGYHMPNYTYPGVPDDRLFESVVERVQAAEAAGFDLVTVMDHFYQIRGVGPETHPMLEAYTTLAALATRTSRVKLGTLVTGVTYRNPAVLAKIVTTLDVISGGRAVMGIGAAWNDSEAAGYGIYFPPIGERMDRLEEAVTIIKLMFTEDRPSFQGKHFTIDRALNSPRPIQAGGPKILIGGGGEKRTLRILARHGDIGHWFGAPLEELKRKKSVFEQHCETVGRDPSEVMLTIGMNIVLVENKKQAEAATARVPEPRRAMVSVATPSEAAEMLRPFMDAGFGGFTLSNMTQPDAESIALAGELIKLVRGSRVAA
ncbi:MAG TPA: LLM class F420-dependent oxidoreductase [Candidatus Sulfotelmatobacter sp.]|nr:LLM class F420-dependent oxidoreductase [Candidatus Sulfotelmatobacter sp.]